MNLTGKGFDLLKQRERLLEDVWVFGAMLLNRHGEPISEFDRTQYALRTKLSFSAIDRLNSVEAELRSMGIETGETQ